MRTPKLASNDAALAQKPAAAHLPSLVAALIIMLVGTIYPPVMMRADGTAHHALALALLWAMSAGLVRGVGFVPKAWVWRLLFSGWSCLAALSLASCLHWGS
jgi:predicted membrane protein